MINFKLKLNRILILTALSTVFSFSNSSFANTCSNVENFNFKNQIGDLNNLGDNLFSDPTNCAFSQLPVGFMTQDKGVTQDRVRELLDGNPMLSRTNNPKGDSKKIVADLYKKITSEYVKNKVTQMRSQLQCKNVEIEYTSDGPKENLMNFKMSFTSDLSPEDLLKYHKIDVSLYDRVGSVYTIKDKKNIDHDVNKFRIEKSNSDRPVYVCTDPQEMEFGMNVSNAPSVDFNSSFLTGLPEFNNEKEVKNKVCDFVKNMKPECIRGISISTSSDRRSNCDRSKNIISKNGENVCPYLSKSVIGRNDFERLSKDRADKLEKILMSCSEDLSKINIKKDALGVRGDGSSGVCPYEVVDKEARTVKIKSEYIKGGEKLDELNQNRYARINIESTRAPGCDGHRKAVMNTKTISIKCLRVQAKCMN